MISLSTAACFALAATPRAEAADPVLVFIFSGQSNMVGYGEGEALPADLSSQPDVLYDHYNPEARDPGENGDAYVEATSTQWGPLEPKGTDNYYGPELTFGRAVKIALPGRTIAIIKMALGGSNIDEHWARNPLGEATRGLPPDPDIAWKSQLYHALMGSYDSAVYDPQPPAEGNNALLYPNEVSRVDNALARFEQAGTAYQLGAFVWMQGENEATRRVEIASQYQARLTAFIAAVRQDLKAPALPFLIGRVSKNMANVAVDPERKPSLDIVRAAQQAIDDADPAVALIDTDDFAPRPVYEDEDDDESTPPVLASDYYHFDSAGYQLMGERFASAFLALSPAAGAGGQGGAAGAGGASGGGVGGGLPAGGAGVGPGGAAGSAPASGDDDDDGCGCSLYGPKPQGALATLPALALAALAGAARRRLNRR
jgi:lysophospholipase L1-like esterase